MKIRRLGWAGVEVEFDGATLVIDAVQDSDLLRGALPDGALTTPRPAIEPTNETVPGRAGWTGCPGRPARSAPRCPAPQGLEGGSKSRTTSGAGRNGH